MTQRRFFIVSLHHIAAQRQSIYFTPKRSGAFKTAAFQFIQTAVFCVLTVKAGQASCAMESEHCREYNKKELAIRPLEFEQTLVAAFTNFSPDPRDRALTELVQDLVISRQILEELPTLSIGTTPPCGDHDLTDWR
jgi:hypothetical protein